MGCSLYAPVLLLFLSRSETMLSFLFFVFLSVRARLSNVTIDDTLGDEHTGEIPQYSPEGWVARSPSGAPCDACTAQPDATHIYKSTWHDKSAFVQEQIPSTISMSFSGTRIYVYFILFNNIGTRNNNTRLRFYLDGFSDPTADYLHLGDPADDRYLYNQVVYDSHDLKHANHTLLISSYSNGTDGSVALFDRAVYTTEPDDDSTPVVGPTASPTVPAPTSQIDKGNSAHTPHLGILIGSSVAGALVLALISAAGVWFYFWRRRGRARLEPLNAHLPGRSQDAVTVACWDRWAAKKAASAESRSQPSQAADDAAQLRSELGWVREELARVRRIAEPPNYSHASLAT